MARVSDDVNTVLVNNNCSCSLDGGTTWAQIDPFAQFKDGPLRFERYSIISDHAFFYTTSADREEWSKILAVVTFCPANDDVEALDLDGLPELEFEKGTKVSPFAWLSFVTLMYQELNEDSP